jgi:GNAT superfamily N-acetyltransferase
MSTRAKAKKKERQQETNLLNAKRALMNECEQIEDPLALVPMFKSFNKNGISATLVSANKCPEEFEEALFNMIEKHMKGIYENTWGWNPDNKLAELFHDSARFILAFVESSPQPIGFVHYRFELDRAEASAYIGDIHVDEAYQGKGLGKFMLQSVEFIALKLKLDAVRVNLFKINDKGRGFFRRMKYIHHSESPAIVDPENDHEYDHEVLFKSLVKKA